MAEDHAMKLLICGDLSVTDASREAFARGDVKATFGDFSTLTATVNEVEIHYGAFLSAVINFLIVALVLFLVIKSINKASSLKKKPEEAPAAPTTKVCPYCKSEIPIGATRCPHCTSELED
jgi:large conductance mechanosensitive channel